MPRKKKPELTFQKHIADYLIREHKYGVLEQSDITDTEHFIAEDHLWAFIKATQGDTLKKLEAEYSTDVRDEVFKALRKELAHTPLWMTQKLMSELFQKDVRTINEHIQNIFEEGELSPESVIRKFRITAADGKSYETQHYNLNVVISVGYRVKSYRGTQFRIWATQRLREYIVKGFTMDDERLKRRGGGQYVEELLARRRHPASRCNELVATLSDEVFIAPATASGQISKLKQRLETWGVKPIHAVE